MAMKSSAVSVSGGQVHHYILDPDKPRPPSQFLDTGIDFRKLGDRVRRNLRGVAGISYEDEFADLAARIYRDGPAAIGGRHYTELLVVVNKLLSITSHHYASNLILGDIKRCGIYLYGMQIHRTGLD